MITNSNVTEKRIEICGNIASGKTTLCKDLVASGCHSIYETFITNPFLDVFYTDPVRFSFETEITFLLQHYHSIKTATVTKPIVCDFSLVLDKAYADVTLPRRRKEIFLKIAQEIECELGFPKKIIHLQCPEEVLLSRIATRNRDFEKSITMDYLHQLSKAIEARVSEISSRCEVITINSHTVNFVRGLDELPHIVLACQEMTFD